MQSICQWAGKCALMYLALSTLASQAGAQYREIGLASYYADYLQGKTTAYGEIYDGTLFTCAHRSHPPGTFLRVTRLDNGAMVTVRVNDRGSFAEGFVISLSKAAAVAIGLEQAGKTRVQVEPTGQPGSLFSEGLSTPGTYETGLTARSPLVNPVTGPLTEKIGEPHAAMPTSKELIPKSWNSGSHAARMSEYEPVPSTPAGINPVVPEHRYDKGPTGPASYAGPATGRVSRILPGSGGYGVQTSSFSSYENAGRQAAALVAMGISEVFILEAKTSGNALVYRIIAGNFQTRIEAERYLDQLRDRYQVSGFIVTL
jgi:rare lipoprotein A